MPLVKVTADVFSYTNNIIDTCTHKQKYTHKNISSKFEYSLSHIVGIGINLWPQPSFRKKKIGNIKNKTWSRAWVKKRIYVKKIHTLRKKICLRLNRDDDVEATAGDFLVVALSRTRFEYMTCKAKKIVFIIYIDLCEQREDIFLRMINTTQWNRLTNVFLLVTNFLYLCKFCK